MRTKKEIKNRIEEIKIQILESLKEPNLTFETNLTEKDYRQNLREKIYLLNWVLEQPIFTIEPSEVKK